MKVISVIVTSNRLELLKKCVYSVINQSYKPFKVIVIDNDSKDGTNNYLSEQNGISFLTQENSGASGGFYTGIKMAFRENPDWVWCLDDDGIPNHDALEKFVEFISEQKSTENLGFIAGKVLWIDGTLHTMNLPVIYNSTGNYDSDREKIANEIVRIKSASYVNLFLSRKFISEKGYPDKRLFIWSDDTEYTMRGQDYINFSVPGVIAVHHTKENTGAVFSFAKNQNKVKLYFGLRNFILIYKKSDKILVFVFLRRLLKIFLIELFTMRVSISNILVSCIAIFNGFTGRYIVPQMIENEINPNRH
ncbi:MAG: glycosyltransferase [Ignavibacteriaceae bacterium]|nr:glycosyltransferase [Ignavibacteriaceae bacterium]